jgi:hypothetical protein
MMTKRAVGERIVLGVLNTVMRGVLRSPLHRVVSGRVLILSLTGRRSGRTISTPLSYLREGDTVTLFTSAAWRRNLNGGALVRLWIAGREYSGWAVTCEDDKEAVAAGLTRFLTRVSGDARYYGVTLDANKVPDPAQVSAAAQRVTMIQVRLSTKGAPGRSPA